MSSRILGVQFSLLFPLYQCCEVISTIFLVERNEVAHNKKQQRKVQVQYFGKTVYAGDLEFVMFDSCE